MDWRRRTGEGIGDKKIRAVGVIRTIVWKHRTVEGILEGKVKVLGVRWIRSYDVGIRRGHTFKGIGLERGKVGYRLEPD